MSFICDNCRKEVRFIPDRKTGVVVKCELEKIVVYTERGMKMEGWPVHGCAGRKDAEK